MTGLGGLPPQLPIDTFTIELDPTTSRPGCYRPGDEITGKLFLSTTEDLHCEGIFAALEGTATVTYKSGHAIRSRTENVLPFEWAAVYFVGNHNEGLPPTDPKYQPPSNNLIKKSNYEYHFCIPIRKLNPFAGSFKGNSGEIEYRVAGYVKTAYVSNTKTVHKVIRVRSYLNLRSVPHTLKPGTVDVQQYKSMFSKKTGLKFSLTLVRTGFLPGVEIPLTFSLLNPHGKRVTKVAVSLHRKIGYTSDLSSRWSKTVCAVKENTDAEFFSAEKAEWADSIVIPDNINYPSVSDLIIQHQYSLSVEVFANDEDSATLKGQLPLTIGTIREIEAATGDSAPVARPLSVMCRSNTDFKLAQQAAESAAGELLSPLREDGGTLGLENLQMERKSSQ